MRFYNAISFSHHTSHSFIFSSALFKLSLAKLNSFRQILFQALLKMISSTLLQSFFVATVAGLALPSHSEKNASSCTFTSASAAISGKKSCTSITLSGITVPAGTTLDMTDLTDGTTVSFRQGCIETVSYCFIGDIRGHHYFRI